MEGTIEPGAVTLRGLNEISQQYAHDGLMAYHHDWRAITLQFDDDGLKSLNQIRIGLTSMGVTVVELVRFSGMKLLRKTSRA